MAKTFFITGTDTDAGKTRVACALLAAGRAQGLSTAALKPVAAGVSETPAGRCNGDVASLLQYCQPELSIDAINPFCFDEPIAPHIAAENTGTRLSVHDIATRCQPVLAQKADLTLVEGAGGWKVPVNDTDTLADLVKALELPVILVVGMKLGCLNHALLTAQAIAADGLQLAGWIANRVDPDMLYYQENLETLTRRLQAPLFAELPCLEAADSGAGFINLSRLP